MGRSPRMTFFLIRPRPSRTRAERHGGSRDGRVTATRGNRSPHIPSLLSALKIPSGRLCESRIHRLSAMLRPRPWSACNTSNSPTLGRQPRVGGV
eukprot:2048760-Prymnesium_polylepis.1